MRHFKICGLAFFFLAGCILHHADCQRIIVNSHGDRIVMFPDGTWRPAEPGDSALINTPGQTPPGKQEGSELSPAKQETTYEEFVMRNWNELHFRIRAQEKKILNEFRAATNAHFSAAEIFHNAEANKDMLEPDRLSVIKENYETSIRNLGAAKRNQRIIQKLLDQSIKLGNLKGEKLGIKLTGLRSRYNAFMAEYTGDPTYVTRHEPSLRNLRPKEKTASPGIQKKAIEIKTPTPITKASDGNEILPPQYLTTPYRSEPFHCIAVIDTIDLLTGGKKIELSQDLMFTHTDPDLRPFFKNKELITCYGTFSKINDRVFLAIEFKIASSHSQSNFGSLQKGSLLRLRLLNGEYVSMFNMKTDNGRIDPYSGHTVFYGQYEIGPKEIKNILSAPVDEIRILWATGYEDYFMFKVDYFIDHLSCLAKN